MIRPANERLWAKEVPLGETIHLLTEGEDPDVDLALLAFDALGSVAHAKMLAAAGLIPETDATALVRGLHRIANLARHGRSPSRPIWRTAIPPSRLTSASTWAPSAPASTWAAPATIRRSWPDPY